MLAGPVPSSPLFSDRFGLSEHGRPSDWRFLALVFGFLVAI
jgi:hypothetical protein